MKVPFLDLKAQYASIRDEIGTALQQVLDRTAFAGGVFVENFEKEFASFCQCDSFTGCFLGRIFPGRFLSTQHLGLSPVPGICRCSRFLCY